MRQGPGAESGILKMRLEAPGVCRRQFLLTAAAAAVTPAAVALAQPAATPDGTGAEFDRLLEVAAQAKLQRSPETATFLGKDKGPLAELKSRLDDRSLAAIGQDRRDFAERLQRLDAIDRKALSGQRVVSYDVVGYWLKSEDEANRRFEDISGRPYVVTQMDGAYASVPDFLDTKHGIKNKADADAYLARLESFATTLDQETERLRHDNAQGVVPPDFVVKAVIEQLTDMARESAKDSVLVSSLAKRMHEQGILGDYEDRATRIYENQIVPALDRQLTALISAQSAATHPAGIWKLKNGDACYAAMLKLMTTTDKSAKEIHELGLEQVRRISGQLDELLRAEGLTQGTVGERLRSMFKDPKYQYPNTEPGKEMLLAELRQRKDEIRLRLPQLFNSNTVPKADVTIERVPRAKEKGAGAYYEQSTIDRSRPGTCYFNLGEMTAWPKWRPASILYHESIPGHHLQVALTIEKEDLPLLSKILEFAAYMEGWALYAEQLADEIGMYEKDPASRIGYLHAALLRAGRLVADTGLHAMRWSRERATQYFVELMGNPEVDAAREIDRYCVTPGQACSYMIGKITWLDLRQRARSALGPRFDLRTFHEVALSSGPLPLKVLDGVVDRYIQGT